MFKAYHKDNRTFFQLLTFNTYLFACRHFHCLDDFHYLDPFHCLYDLQKNGNLMYIMKLAYG